MNNLNRIVDLYDRPPGTTHIYMFYIFTAEPAVEFIRDWKR